MELLEVFQKYFVPVPEDSNRINSGLCKKCAGRCCSNLGCHISPDDLKEITIDSIINLIDESNVISIDWWEGDPVTEDATGDRVYFLRIKNEDAKTIDPAFGGHRCGILTENGCPLPFSYRPKGARDLIPVPGDCECKDQYSKQQCCIDWMKHQDVLSAVYEHYNIIGDVTINIYTLLGRVLGGGLF